MRRMIMHLENSFDQRSISKVCAVGRSRRQNLFAAAALATASLSSLILPQRALGDANWVGGVDQSWNNGANWSLNPPTGNFFINTATGNFPILNANSAFTPTDLIIGNGGTNS